MKKPASHRRTETKKAAPTKRLRGAEKRLAEAEKKYAPFTQPVESPWISTHDKWGLGDAASIRNLRAN